MRRVMEECFKGEEKDRNEGKDWGGLTDRPPAGLGAAC